MVSLQLERSVGGVRMGKSGPLERTLLANQLQGFRIPDRWDATENNNNKKKKKKKNKNYIKYKKLINFFILIY